ncbi:hypothetical protein K456DRAFT_326878 [Colletotrichum gloeosporioides 23]|nr:hypothetical protein K456DRAFT_326878 [Colletotrichum gloeosporioides 23]
MNLHRNASCVSWEVLKECGKTYVQHVIPSPRTRVRPNGKACIVWERPLVHMRVCLVRHFLTSASVGWTWESTMTSYRDLNERKLKWLGLCVFASYFCWFAGGAGRRQLFFLRSLAVG